jgi:hypothetical protein
MLRHFESSNHAANDSNYAKGCQLRNATDVNFLIEPLRRVVLTSATMKKKDVKSEVVGIRFEEPLLTRLKKAAIEDKRKLSDFVRVTLDRAISEKKSA